MTPDRWHQVSGIYNAALAREPSLRAQFLRQACAGDAALLQEVESLLAGESAADRFMESPAVAVAAAAIAVPSGSMTGRTIGPFRVLSLIGAGGMGDVYRAHDTKLGRDVAIKILPPAFMADADRRARLEREARLLATLNHPHIAAIYGFEDVESVRALVLELVEGDTLAERIARGPLTTADAVMIARQIAEALDAAHEKGIVHRDLKPANIKVTPTGSVKVLDFGLAKAMTGVSGGPVPTVTGGTTQEGTILGTPAYMSPEQARGQPVDKRTDIWAFGCVLFEMLTGRAAFAGDTATDVLAAVVNQEPDWDRLPASLPASVRHVLERCLEKDSRRRLRDIGDAVVEIDPRRLRARWQPVAIAFTVAAALAAGAFLPGIWRGSRSEAEPPIPITSYPGIEDHPSFSPDGRYVAFRWNGESEDNFDIYVKQVGQPKSTPLTSNPASDIRPFWSPDGNWIAFTRDVGPLPPQPGPRYMTYVIPALGGAERPVSTGISQGWSADSKWLLISERSDSGQSQGLAVVSVETGDVRQLTSPLSPQADFNGALAPDGRALVIERLLGINVRSLWLLPVSDALQPGSARELKVPRRIVSGDITWTADSREVIFSSGGNAYLWRVAADNASDPVRIQLAGERAYGPAVSADGKRLAFSQGVSEKNIWSLELDEAGRPVGHAVLAPFNSSKTELCPAFSPDDGARVAVGSNRSGNDEIWVCESDSNNCHPVTSFDGPHAGSPAWSPDGTTIAFDGSGEDGSEIYVVSANGGKPRKLTKGVVPRWSRDGKWVYYYLNGGLYRVSFPGGEPDALAVTSGNPFVVMQESVDRHWIYYSTNANEGRTKVLRVPASGGSATPTEILPDVAGRDFEVVKSGIWYFKSGNNREGNTLYFYDFASKHSREVYRTEHHVAEGLTLAPNGRRILFTQLDRRGSDIMMIENFR